MPAASVRRIVLLCLASTEVASALRPLEKTEETILASAQRPLVGLPSEEQTVQNEAMAAQVHKDLDQHDVAMQLAANGSLVPAMQHAHAHSAMAPTDLTYISKETEHSLPLAVNATASTAMHSDTTDAMAADARAAAAVVNRLLANVPVMHNGTLVHNGTMLLANVTADAFAAAAMVNRLLADITNASASEEVPPYAAIVPLELPKPRGGVARQHSPRARVWASGPEDPAVAGHDIVVFREGSTLLLVAALVLWVARGAMWEAWKEVGPGVGCIAADRRQESKGSAVNAPAVPSTQARKELLGSPFSQPYPAAEDARTLSSAFEQGTDVFQRRLDQVMHAHRIPSPSPPISKPHGGGTPE